MDIKSQIDLVLKKHRGLNYIESQNIIIGKLQISDNDFYEIKIDLTPYPKAFPKVEEVGERIPKKADRHIYTDSGSCCFTTRAIAEILLKTKVKSINDFIKLIVIPYFENNSFYEINKYYLNGEFSHNIQGILEGYKEILGLKNDYKTLKIINDEVRGNNTHISAKCYCGSTKSLKNCSSGKHFKNYRKFKLIDKSTLTYDLVQILDFLIKK